ncbi:hypothetical protein J6590_103004, partial [Homalodisca vitripennis]
LIGRIYNTDMTYLGNVELKTHRTILLEPERPGPPIPRIFLGWRTSSNVEPQFMTKPSDRLRRLNPDQSFAQDI